MVIDNQGRLFGLVNVIDVLVVLLVVTVIITGILFIDPFSAPPSQATRYATVDLGPQPNYLVERVTAGDRMSLENSPDNLTITDVYFGPADGGTHLTVRVQLNGERIENPAGPDRFLFGGEPFLVGQELAIETIAYTVTGSVTRLETAGNALQTDTTAVVASTTVSPAESERLQVGDAYRVEGQAVAVLRTVQRFPAPGGDGHLAILGIELSTIERGATTRFGQHAVGLGATVPFEAATYSLQPEIVQLGTADIPTTETRVVIDTTVPTTVVDDVQAGDTFDLGDDTIATLESVAVYPTANRTQRRIVLGATLVTRNEGNRQFFAGHPVGVGAMVPFSTPAYDLTGEVIRTGTTEPPGDPTTTAATVKLENVPPELADDIRAGMIETVRGETVARVVDRHATPAIVILESDDGNIYAREHPRNLDVTLTVELQTRETSTDLRFHGQPVQIGDTIVLNLGPITVQAEVTSFD